MKEKWRKLRDCHREALRRQKKRKRGDTSDLQKPWTYQYQMEFLIPFMKNKLTPPNPQDPTDSNNLSIIDDAEDIVDKAGGDDSLPPVSYEVTISKSVENEIPAKKVNNRGGLLLIRKATEKIAEIREEIRQKMIDEGLSLQRDQNDALFQFFLSMYSTTKGLPSKYQRQIRNKVYEAVSQAEEQHAYEISRDAILLQCSSCSSSKTTHPTSPTD